MYGWMSPKFGPVGCVGASILFVLMVAAILSMLYLPWSMVYGH